MERPGDRPTVGGDEADDHVRVGEVRLVAHVHHVGQRHEAAAEPDRRTVDRGDDRHAALDHVHHDALARLDRDATQRAVVGEFADVVEVAAGRERPAVAGEHHGARVAVDVDLRPQVGETLVQVWLTALRSSGRFRRTMRIGPSASTTISSGTSYMVAPLRWLTASVGSRAVATRPADRGSAWR